MVSRFKSTSQPVASVSRKLNLPSLSFQSRPVVLPSADKSVCTQKDTRAWASRITLSVCSILERSCYYRGWLTQDRTNSSYWQPECNECLPNSHLIYFVRKDVAQLSTSFANINFSNPLHALMIMYSRGTGGPAEFKRALNVALTPQSALP